MRLQKYLAECGVASRRASEKLIEAGGVTVNGEVARIGCSVEPGVDEVLVNDSPIETNEKVYAVLNKPEGAVTTTKDTHGRKTVMDCLDGVKAPVFPVGRLDMDVSGVLLFTNNGELAHRLMHPSYEIEKTYLVWVRGRVAPRAIEVLERGVALEDGVTAAAKAAVLRLDVSATLLRLTLREGRKREVKRMCAAAGHPVRSLTRISFGGIGANGLRSGEWRYLRGAEVAHLCALVKL